MTTPGEYGAVHRRALPRLSVLLSEWLPSGKCIGDEYVALNPTRNDRHLGSFKINVTTGKWADFATGDRGGDIVALYAYLFDLRQSEAAKRLNNEIDTRFGSKI